MSALCDRAIEKAVDQRRHHIELGLDLILIPLVWTMIEATRALL